MVHRIYVGGHNIDKNSLVTMASTLFQGFTLFDASGYWKGEEEPGHCIEVAGEDDNSVNILAEQIKHKFNQEAVLVTKQETEQVMV